MTTATLTTERLAEAVGNLIDQFRGQPNFQAFIRAWAQQSQDVETAAFGVLTLTTLANAVGEQLDGTGSIVGVEREGRSDADYRVRIGAQIVLNNASGTIEDLLQLSVALGATTTVLTEVYPAKLEIVSEVAIANGIEIGRVMGLARPAGVGHWFTYFEGTTPLRFDVSGQGLDQGELAGVVTSGS